MKTNKMNYKKALNLCRKKYKNDTKKRDKIYFKILKRIDKKLQKI